MSMTENGDPYENAIAERINGILKYEHGLKETFKNLQTAQVAVDIAVKAYNELRIHDSCNRLTPIKAHEEKGVLKKYWNKKVGTYPFNGWFVFILYVCIIYLIEFNLTLLNTYFMELTQCTIELQKYLYLKDKLIYNKLGTGSILVQFI